MNKFKRQLGRRRRLIHVWLILLTVALAGGASRYCRSAGIEFCSDSESFGHWIASYGLHLAIPTALFVCIFLVLRFVRRSRERAEGGFKNEPWKYDRETLELVGQIDYLMGDSLAEMGKRKFIDWFRTKTGNDDFRHRYIHQRFLLKSENLLRGERILVLHNTKYGKLPLKEGTWVKLKGEYLHGESRAFNSRRHFYGQIHYTHEPRGYLEVLPGKPRP